MDPVSMAAIGTAVSSAAGSIATPTGIALTSAALTAAGTGVGAYSQYQAANAQSAADRQRAAIESEWNERRALEEKGAAQRAATQEMRKAKLMQSRLTALAGGSGSGTDDATVMDLWGDIEKEGRISAANITAGADQKAAGLGYQSALDVWGADAQGRIRSSAAKTALAGNLLGAAGQFGSSMAGRYGSRNASGYRGYYG